MSKEGSMDYQDNVSIALDVATEVLSGIEYLDVVEHLADAHPDLSDDEFEAAAGGIVDIARGLRVSR